MHSFLFRELQLITVLLLICNSYKKLKHIAYLSETVFEIFRFQFRLLFIKLYIFVQQLHRLFEFKTSQFPSN